MTEPVPTDDVTLVEQMLDRVATPEEAAAARRLLGVDQAARAAALEWAPAMPPPVLFPESGHLAHARRAAGRFEVWVASFPDDDPTPLADRERALRLARLDVARLEGQ